MSLNITLLLILLFIFVESLVNGSEQLPDSTVITSSRVGVKAEKHQYPYIFRYLAPPNYIVQCCIILRNILQNNVATRRAVADFQLDIGLFIAQVFLRKALRNTQHMNTETANYIYYLLKDLKQQRDFNFKSSEEERNKYVISLNMLTAVRNILVEDYWVDTIAELSVVSLDPFWVNDTNSVYTSWERYSKLVTLSKQPQVNAANENGIRDFINTEHIGLNVTKFMNQSKTNPLFSAIIDYMACFQKLLLYYGQDKSLKDRHDRSKFPRCVNFDKCAEKIKNGRYWGMESNQRLQILLFAKYGFRCNLTENDQALLDQLCSYTFNEAYLTGMQKSLKENENDVLNVQAGSIMLCSLEGHALFLRRQWLEFFMQFNTRYGCFAFEQTKIMSEANYRAMNSRSPDFAKLYNRSLYSNQLCNAALTSSMAAVLANTIRFILETYY